MRLVVIAIILIKCSFVFGQIFPPPQDSLFWFQKRLVRLEYGGTSFLESHKNTPKLPEKRFGNTGSMRDIHCVNGLFYGTTRNESDLVVMSSSDGIHWDQDAIVPIKFDQQQPKASRILCLGGNDYLILGAFSPFRDRDGESFIALGRKGPLGRVEFSRILDMGIGKSSHSKASIPSNAFVPVFNPITIQTDDGVLLIVPKIGYVFVITRSSDSGVKLRFKAIYPEVQAALDKSEEIEPVVLGAQPTSNGDVWIATRSLKAVMNGRKAWKTLVPETGKLKKPEGIDKKTYMEMVKSHHSAEWMRPSQVIRDAENLAITTYPEIEWWELEPNQLKLRKIDPPGAKTVLVNADDIRKFKFKFRSDGCLLM